MTRPTPDLLCRLAAIAGFAWTEDELGPIAPLVERSLASLRALESLPLGDVEPSVFFRID